MTCQLPTPGGSLSSPPLGQAMPGSSTVSPGSCPTSVDCGLAACQSLAMSESPVAEVTPGSGNQTQLFLQALAAQERPAAESMEQRSGARHNCSRLQGDSRAGRGSVQLLPGSEAAGGGPQLGSSPCLAQGSPTAAAAAQAAGRQQPRQEGSNRAAATVRQTAPGLGCAPACETPPSQAVCAALWLYGTSQSQRPSAGLPARRPSQPTAAAHALAAGSVSSSARDCLDARPGPAEVHGGPSGKRSAEAALPPGAGTAGSPIKRHRVQPGTASLPVPAPQAAEPHLKALAQPAPSAAPLPRPAAQAGTADRLQQQRQQHLEAGEQGGGAHGHSKPLVAGVSWYELHRPSEQAVSQQAEQDTVERRLRHLQVRAAAELLERCVLAGG